MTPEIMQDIKLFMKCCRKVGNVNIKDMIEVPSVEHYDFIFFTDSCDTGGGVAYADRGPFFMYSTMKCSEVIT
jgi:hypothetical protein